jgi:hypothetical protein
MSLPTNNKGKDKQSGKAAPSAAGGSKFITKPGKASTSGANTNKKIVKTGGSRGS